MAVSTSEARAKLVLSALADLSSRSDFICDKVSQLGAPLMFGESIDVGSISDLTVTASGSTGASAQTPTVAALNCIANLDPAIFVKLTRPNKRQLLNGQWQTAMAVETIQQLKNYMDNALCRDYLIQSLAYDSSATYHVNLAGDSMALADLTTARAKLLANDGCMQQNLLLILNPYAEGSMMGISQFVMNHESPGKGVIGLDRIGRVMGMDVIVSNAIPSGRSVTVTATNIASNVCTATIGSGHGLVPGMKIYTSGLTVDVAAASSVAITSVTATTAVFALTASNGSNGTGSIIVDSCENLLIDKAHVFVAQQEVPDIRVVPYPESTADALQAFGLWGRIGRAGRSIVIHTPRAAV